MTEADAKTAPTAPPASASSRVGDRSEPGALPCRRRSSRSRPKASAVVTAVTRSASATPHRIPTNGPSRAPTAAMVTDSGAAMPQAGMPRSPAA
jgi:hypothetical protein